ncbi:hypothetical protein [Tunturiibacter lichenicola]|uniref:hypothetical protein n=1 Tax=Tunturiibacter lichenicola TaxID=2051959 RepID=UPI003D9B23CA
MENRDVSSLKGARVWVKVVRGELMGIIESVPKPVSDSDWQHAINLSVFSVRLEGGELLETSGWYFSRIDEEPSKIS